MAQRFDADFKNLISQEVVWRVELHDDLGSPVGDFESVNGVDIVWEGMSNDPAPGIYPTRATVNFLVEDAQYEFYIEDLIDHPRDRFFMRIYRDSVYYWGGRFATEDIAFEDQSFPSVSAITATDGFGYLQSVDWTSTNWSSTSVMSIIEDCFDEMGMYDVHSGTIFMAIVCDWYNGIHANTTDNPLSVIAVNKQRWRGDGEGDYESFYTVLTDICEQFNLICTHSQGYYQIYNLRSIATGSWRKFYYDSGWNLLSSVDGITDTRSISTDYSNYTAPFGGANRWTVLSGLKSYLSTCERKLGLFRTDITFDRDNDTEVSLGNITWSNEYTMRVRVKLRSDTDPTVTFPSVDLLDNHRYRWKIDIRFEDLDNVEPDVYIRHDENMDGTNGGSYFTPSRNQINGLLTTTPSDIEQSSKKWIGSGSAGNILFDKDFDEEYYNRAITVLGPGGGDILVDGVNYEVFMRVYLDEVVTDTLTAITDGSWFQWEASNIEIEFGQGNDANDPDIIIESKGLEENPKDFETKIEKEVKFCDAPNDVAGLYCWNGSAWIYSTKTWYHRVLGGDGVSILRLRSREFVQLRMENRRMYEGAFIDHQANFTQLYAYQNRVYWPMGRMQMRTSQDLIIGRFFELFESATEPTGSDIDVIDQDVDQTPIFPDDPLPPRKPLELGQYLTSGLTSVVQLAMFNNTGLNVISGTLMRVTNRFGKYRIFQLNEDIDGTDPQTVSIAPRTFDVNFHANDEIKVADVESLREGYEVFQCDPTDVSNNYLELTKTQIVDSQYFDNAEDYWYLEVKRFGGNTVAVHSFLTQANMSSHHYGIDISGSNNRITFPTNFPLNNGEFVIVRGYYARL